MSKLVFIKSETEVLSVDSSDLSHIDYDSVGVISALFEIYSVGQLGTVEVKLNVKELFEKEAIEDITRISNVAGTHVFSNVGLTTGRLTSQGVNKTKAAKQASTYVISVGDITYITGATEATGIPAGGDTDQVLAKASGDDYDAEWVDFSTLYIRVRNVSGGILYKGSPVHATGVTGNTPDVIAADASSSSLMPATYVLNEDIDNNGHGQAIIVGEITGVDTSSFSPGDVVYVASGGGFTNVKPTGPNLIQNLGIVTRSNASTGSGVIYGSGRSNDVPNLSVGKFFIGSGTNTEESAYTLPTSDGVANQVLTTNGAGAVTFTSFTASDVVNDLTPQLGGNLDVQTYNIFTSSTNGDIVFTPDGTGSINLDGTVQFKRFTSAPTAFEGGMYADDNDNLYFGVS